MKYMMLIKHTDDYRGKKPPQGLMDAMDEFIGGYAKQGSSSTAPVSSPAIAASGFVCTTASLP